MYNTTEESRTHIIGILEYQDSVLRYVVCSNTLPGSERYGWLCKDPKHCIR